MRFKFYLLPGKGTEEEKRLLFHFSFLFVLICGGVRSTPSSARAYCYLCTQGSSLLGDHRRCQLAIYKATTTIAPFLLFFLLWSFLIKVAWFTLVLIFVIWAYVLLSHIHTQNVIIFPSLSIRPFLFLYQSSPLQPTPP